MCAHLHGNSRRNSPGYPLRGTFKPTKQWPLILRPHKVGERTEELSPVRNADAEQVGRGLTLCVSRNSLPQVILRKWHIDRGFRLNFCRDSAHKRTSYSPPHCKLTMWFGRSAMGDRRSASFRLWFGTKAAWGDVIVSDERSAIENLGIYRHRMLQAHAITMLWYVWLSHLE